MSDKLAIARQENERLKESLAQAIALSEARGVDPSTWTEVQDRIESAPFESLVDFAESLRQRDPDKADWCVSLLRSAEAAQLELRHHILLSELDPALPSGVSRLKDLIAEVNHNIKEEWRQVSEMRVAIKAFQEAVTRCRKHLQDQEEEIDVE